MKKLHLSSQDRIIGGVCGGLSESTGVNSGIFRAVFVVSIFIGGMGLLVYIILLAILPRGTKKDIINVEVEEEGEDTRIRRSRTNSMIAGVCGGLAVYLHWDVSIIRILFIIMTMAGGIGAILYLLFWFMFPLED